MTAEAIFTEALALPSEQRAQLAEQLRLSLRAASPLPQPPIPEPEGSLGDHPLFEEWLAAVAAYRKQREMNEEAFDELVANLTTRLSPGTPFIDPPIPQRPSPVAELPLAENPLWPDFSAAVEEYRNRRDAEDRAAYADEN